MAIKKSYVGGQIVAWDENGKYADNGESICGFRTEDQMLVETAPTDDDHVLRLGDLTSRMPVVSVVSILSPTELATYRGTTSAPYLLARQTVSAGDDLVTLYVWSLYRATGQSAPYVMSGLSGYWIAVGGYCLLADRISSTTVSASNNSDTDSALFGLSTGNGAAIWGLSYIGNGSALKGISLLGADLELTATKVFAITAETTAGEATELEITDYFTFVANKTYLITIKLVGSCSTEFASFIQHWLVTVSATGKTVTPPIATEGDFAAATSGSACDLVLTPLTGMTAYMPVVLTGSSEKDMTWNGTLEVLEV